ncbi:hypothetical protein ACQV5M_20490, partial [Leptospira sp. SA-E8]|uniref:hypothetical protein n=1 Tax=Leptospira sp. SA-E8 TaxID=3422259 RepID=UPI003EBD942B
FSTFNGGKLSAGWNRISGFSAVPAQALRMDFLNGSGSAAEFREIRASGSGVGPAYAPAIAVAYPDAGQFYGRKAYIRGFLTLPDNGSGAATLNMSVPAADGTATLRPLALGADGSFGLLIGKDEAGYAKQSAAEPWQVQLVARYPDGQQVTQTVPLNQGYDEAQAHQKLPTEVNPGASAVIQKGGVDGQRGPALL